jgi:hypothetical protein
MFKADRTWRKESTTDSVVKSTSKIDEKERSDGKLSA